MKKFEEMAPPTVDRPDVKRPKKCVDREEYDLNIKRLKEEIEHLKAYQKHETGRLDRTITFTRGNSQSIEHLRDQLKIFWNYLDLLEKG